MVDSSLLMSAGIALVAVCALLAATGFKGRSDTVGIDLGTTFSVVAIRGAMESYALRDEEGRALVPSAVYFAPNGSVLVGRAAETFQHADPAHFIYNAKRFIGRDSADSAVSEQGERHPFKLVSNMTASLSTTWFGSPTGRVLTPAQIKPKVSAAKHIVDTVGNLISKALESKTKAYAPGGGGAAAVGNMKPYQDFSAPWAAVSPETVGAHVLKRLLDIAELNLGHRNVNKAVMAVPAKFNSAQRQATVEAFKQAGLRVMRIIDEPTAAALAYGLDKKPNVNYILVYDFGGGTLDVSLLFVNKESVQVIATHGDDLLGGADFDQCLEGVLRRDFATVLGSSDFEKSNSCEEVVLEAAASVVTKEEKESGGDGSGTGAADGDEVRKHEAALEARAGEVVLPCSPSNLRTLAERLKRDLSSSDNAVAKCVASPPRSTRQQEGCTVATVEVSKSKFETECASLLGRILQPVEDLLNEALMPREEIDEVVLVGGSSRIPAVRNALKTFFNLDHLNQEIDPDLTIAIGAASIVD